MAALPNAPALRVVGRDDTFAAQQTMDAARAQAQAPPPRTQMGNTPFGPATNAPPQGLAGFVTDQYIMMRRHRDTIGRGWSDRLLSAVRAYNGVYDANVIEEIKKFGGSNVYSRLIAMKCRGTTSLLRDIYLGAERPWSVEPASDPDVPDAIMEAIAQVVSGEVQQMIQAHFQSLQANEAHFHGVQAAHAMGAASGVHPAFTDAAIPSHNSGPSQGMHTGAIPPGAPAPPMGGGGLPPPPPPVDLPDPSHIRDRYSALVEDARSQAKRKAADQAKITEDKFQEHLAMGGFYNAFAEFLVDLPVFPYACLKGPTVRIKTQVKWTKDVAPWSNNPSSRGLQASSGSAGAMMGGPSNTQMGNTPSGPLGSAGPQPGMGNPQGLPPKPQPQMAQAVVQDIPVLCWERVSPFDIYWTPGVADIGDANVIQRSRLTRAEINDLLDLPGFITEEVRAVLDEYGRGGLVDNWDMTDAERAILENREDPRFNQSGLIACLEFQGMAQGRHLLDLGMDPRLVPDPLRDYFCNAWLIGRHIIKVQMAMSPRKRHQYYVTSFEKIPGSPVGNGLPDLLADISSVANATLRAMVNNLSISSGPQVVINEDRIADGENPDQMYPWKRWRVKTDPFGNNTEKAIEFFSPTSNSQELLQVYMAFSQLADEHSAIPKFMTGSPPTGGLGRTASGLSMLMQNSSKILQTVAANVDRDIVEPILDSLYDMVMMTDETGLLTGEEKIRVRGVETAVQRETQRARQLEFLQITGNPIDLSIIKPKGRAQVLRSVASEIGLPGENIVPTDEQMEQEQKQQEAAQAQMMAQGGPPNAAPGPHPPMNAGGGPGGGPSGQPPQQPGGSPPRAATADQGPRMNLMNPNLGGGPPVRGGVG